MAFGDPGAGAESQNLLAVEPARVGEVDGLEGGRMAHLPVSLRETDVLRNAWA